MTITSTCIEEANTFSHLLRAHRQRRSLTLRQLAQAAGCDMSYLARLEGDLKPPPGRDILDALARALLLTGFAYRQFVTAAGYSPVQVWTPELEATHRARRNDP